MEQIVVAVIRIKAAIFHFQIDLEFLAIMSVHRVIPISVIIEKSVRREKPVIGYLGTSDLKRGILLKRAGSEVAPARQPPLVVIGRTITIAGCRVRPMQFIVKYKLM